MKFLLFFLGIGAVLSGLMVNAAAKTAIHEILGAQGVIGGLTLIGLAAVIEAVDRAATKIIGAITRLGSSPSTPLPPPPSS